MMKKKLENQPNKNKSNSTKNDGTILYAHVLCRNHAENTDTVYKVEAPFRLKDFKSDGAEYTRNWCKEILYAYQVGHYSTYKLLLKTEKGKIVKIYTVSE